METPRRRAASGLIGVATAVAVLALVIPLFLNPAWVAFEQGRAQATAWTGFDAPQLRAATDAILADLVFGPPDFDVEVAVVAALVAVLAHRRASGARVDAAAPARATA